jgi:hypothetical protein
MAISSGQTKVQLEKILIRDLEKKSLSEDVQIYL